MNCLAILPSLPELTSHRPGCGASPEGSMGQSTENTKLIVAPRVTTGKSERSARAGGLNGKQSLEFTTDFMARITHGIRSPLNIILGFTDLLADRFEQLGDDTQRPYLEGIERNGQQIIDTIDRLLDMSLIANHIMPTTPETIELAPFLEKRAQDFRVLAVRKNLQLICEISAPEAVVRCDEHCLATALSNLVENAIKFTRKGGVIMRLYRDDSETVSIDVRDSGDGFNVKHLDWMLNAGGGGSKRQVRYESTGL